MGLLLPRGRSREAWSRFKDLFLAAADQCILSFTLRPRRTKSWLSEETLSLIKRKKRAYRIAKRTGKPIHQSRYRTMCNTVRKLTRRDHSLHIQQITENLHRDQKPFWRWLKNTKGGHHTIPDVHYQGNILSSALEKANALNSFFSSVFTKEVINNLNDLRQSLLPSKSASEIRDIEFNHEDVYNLLCTIDPSKPPGPDNITGRLYREGAAYIAEPIINLSIKSGQLPEDCTRANVTPVFIRRDPNISQIITDQ